MGNWQDKGKKGVGILLIPVRWYAADKQKHSARGMFTGVSYFLLKYALGLNTWLAIGLALAVVLGVSIFNEIKQRKMPNRVSDYRDVIAEVIPVLIYIALNLINEKHIEL